ncbi:MULTISPECIES: succinate dehydrogenase [Cereibacter]|uniref:succinate dehydrogenase n=1 Tax=Cereibacter TaxID=1653176 RepID=UPI000C6D7854|nr:MULTISPECIES: succinate dehydrogenase [Cereibacter]RDS95405.1 succinate dehydrogenase [Cereibacter sphaeroides f. sp. denitrificans]MEA5160341.1 succinate dehydrogenase [Cereibacter johrii]QCP87609.1 succinate dehydrogenase [Cereibacter sphaeroides]RAZ85139.1 succinate dehydrogenase [Cereibacter johrii]RHZ99094.1 succinate dehydrogenase [Cereibacter sphaeroides]
MLDLRLYMLQRLSALVMAPLVLGHLALMIYAVQGGISAGEILARTQGSLGWALYYGLFLVAAAIHAAIGLRVILAETLALRSRAFLDLFTLAVGAVFLILGLRALHAVTLA